MMRSLRSRLRAKNSAALVILTAVVLTNVSAAAAGPPNDNCGFPIRVTDGPFMFSTLGATTDGPPDPACLFSLSNQVDSDIWYEYIATCTGNLTISLCASNYDTKLAVYAGCDAANCPPSDSPVACDDDSCGSQSEVTLPVVEGTCYTIRVGGFNNAQGMGTMTIQCVAPPPPSGACCDNGDCIGTLSEADCAVQNGMWFEGEDCAAMFTCPSPPPSNDECVNPIAVFTDVPVNGSTVGAGGTDITLCALNDSLDVWHVWTADCTGTATFSLCGSSFDTTLAVFDVCGGSELACNDDSCFLQSQLTLSVISGQMYFIRVAGHDGATGDYTLTVEPCPPPDAGACCFTFAGFDLCRVVTLQECPLADGTFSGPGSVCLDGDGNGIDDICELGLDDFAMFADCLSGPGVTPNPTPPTTVEDCLALFDTDADNDIDLFDYDAFLARFTGSGP